MRNKYRLFCFYLLLILFLQIVFIHPISARSYLLQTSSSTKITDKEDTLLIKPLETKTIPLTITYTYGRFARPEGFLFPRQKKPVIMNFTILKEPHWCIVSIDKGSFEIPINTFVIKKNEIITLTANLTIQNINPYTPAFERCTIECKAQTFQNGNINPSSDKLEILVEIDLHTDIEIDIDSSVDLIYGDEKILYLILKNTGNLNLSCIVSTEENHYLDINLDKNVNIDINKEKIIPIFLNNKTSENINRSIQQKFTLTGDAEEYEDLKNVISKEFQVKVNLFEKKNDEKMDEELILSILIFVSIILIIGPIFVTYLFYKKRQNLNSI